jgi:epoxyqueuosine reductase QueG
VVTTSSIQSIHDAVVARIGEDDLFGVAALDSPLAGSIRDAATAILPGAVSIVVVASEVFAEVLDLVVPEKTMGEASARELYAPHLDYINGRLNRAIYELARSYRRAGFQAVPMPSMGTPSDARFQRGILSFKGAAVLAGLGGIGQNSLLITPRFGPRVRLACLLTDAELVPNTPLPTSPCNQCGDCVVTCPAGAITEPAAGEACRIDRFACCAYRGGAGACSTCMQVCPIGR